MSKLALIMKILQAAPQVVGEIEEITEDRFISLHEVLCGIEQVAKAFGLDPQKIGVEIRKDGTVGIVYKEALKKEA